jgi:hypothetical protein
MRYILLIYGNEAEDTQQTPAQLEAEMQAYSVFTEEAHNAGVLRAGEALLETAKARTVRTRNGKTTTTDGPFAETKEYLGGYYVIECDHLDDAIQWAAKIPHAAKESIEIRPLLEFN